jgi:hypothetical protein
MAIVNEIPIMIIINDMFLSRKKLFIKYTFVSTIIYPFIFLKTFLTNNISKYVI